jgi:hypothetical protein
LNLSEYLPKKYANIYAYLSYDTDKITFIIFEALRLLGVDAESDEPDTNRLYYYGSKAFLKQALDDLSTNFQYNGASQQATHNRQTIYDQISKLYDALLSQENLYSKTGGLRTIKIKFADNPFDLDSYADWWV